MSYQATMARAEARAADRAWRQHQVSCPTCGAAARRRRYADLCPEGSKAWQERRDLRAAAGHEAELGKMPPPGQAALFDLGDLP